MTQRSDRAEKREAQSDPINYTCGGCRKVNVYDSDKPYVCPHCKYGTPREA